MAAALPSPVSLYVGDLHPDVTDEQLLKAFAEFETVVSVRVCKDVVTGRSLCYGFVNFVDVDSAARAMEAMNHSNLNGKDIRVAWSRRDSDARKSGIGNVFVKNLGESIDSVKLQDIFQKFGNIMSCKVARAEDGKSKGYGFVQFESEEAANSAIEKLNSSSVEGKQIYVGRFMKRSERILPSPDTKYTNLYIKNVDPNITEEVLREKFSEFGRISSLIIAKDESGASKGFGFVCFDSPDNARKATEVMNGSQLGTKVLNVSRAQKKVEREQILSRQFEQRQRDQIRTYKESNVYVKNINDDVTDEELQSLFSLCGTVTSSKIMRDNKGISKGFGFVCFSSPKEANKAVNTFHGYMFHRKPLYVAIAQRKEERQAQLRIQFAQNSGLSGSPTTVIPAGYPPFYYPSGIVSQVAGPRGLIYQSVALRPGWGANGFLPPRRPVSQHSPRPVIPDTQRQNRRNRGRTNGHVLPRGGADQYVQQPTPEDPSDKEQPGQAKYVPNGHASDSSKGSSEAAAASNTFGVGSQELETLSSMLDAASHVEQKQILGEHLFPLVQKYEPDHTAKITGMLLEMDNEDLLLMLESPESLVAKVDEAVKVLKDSKSEVSNKDSLNSNVLSAEVTVN